MDRFFIVGEKSQCDGCFAFFKTIDAIKQGSHVYCSETCKQYAADESRLARVEFQRQVLEAA